MHFRRNRSSGEADAAAENKSEEKLPSFVLVYQQGSDLVTCSQQE